MKVKTCSRCGVEQPLDEFRTYYNRQGSHYSFCKTCERIESRRKYLRRKYNLSVAEQEELNNINELYSRRKAKGLNVPGTRRNDVSVSRLVREALDEEL